MVGSNDFPNALDSEANGRSDDDQRNRDGCDRLRLAVSVWMLLVRRLRGDFQPEPDDE
jgi:hypothetical protein